MLINFKINLGINATRLQSPCVSSPCINFSLFFTQFIDRAFLPVYVHLAGDGACSHFLQCFQCLYGCSYFLFCINAPQALLSSWLSSIVPGAPVSCRGHAPLARKRNAHRPPPAATATAVDGNLLKKFRFLVFFVLYSNIFAWPLCCVGGGGGSDGVRSLFISCPALSSSYSENSQRRTMPAIYGVHRGVYVLYMYARLNPGNPIYPHRWLSVCACQCFLFYLNGAQVKCVSP